MILFWRHRPSRMFLTVALLLLLLTAEASLGNACGAECGAAAALTIFTLFFIFSLLLILFHCVKWCPTQSWSAQIVGRTRCPIKPWCVLCRMMGPTWLHFWTEFSEVLGARRHLGGDLDLRRASTPIAILSCLASVAVVAIWHPRVGNVRHCVWRAMHPE